MYVCVSVSESQQSTVKRNGCDGDDGGACAVNLTMILTFCYKIIKNCYAVNECSLASVFTLTTSVCVSSA